MNVDYAHAVKKRDHHEFLGGLALSGLLGSGRSSMLPLGTLSMWMFNNYFFLRKSKYFTQFVVVTG